MSEIKLKYEDEIRSLFSIQHEWWMDDDDKRDLDKMLIDLFGERFDRDIQTGIDNGHSLEFQMALCKKMLKVMDV